VLLTGYIFSASFAKR